MRFTFICNVQVTCIIEVVVMYIICLARSIGLAACLICIDIVGWLPVCLNAFKLRIAFSEHWVVHMFVSNVWVVYPTGVRVGRLTLNSIQM